jgi:hypothetical protein
MGYWYCKDGETDRSPIVLSQVTRYAGMVSGKMSDGRPCARPLVDVDELSEDGVTWCPAFTLRGLIPWEIDEMR